MKTKFLRGSILLVALLLIWQVGRAVSGETPGMDTPSPATPAMQAALAQSTAQHSDTPILTLLATVPRSEQATLALNLFSAISDDLEARGRVGTIILLAPVSAEGISSRHMLLLTRAYLQTVEHPLKGSRSGLDAQAFDDRLFQRKTRLILGAYLGAPPLREDWSPDTTPLDKLKRVFAQAENVHPDQITATRIQACKNLLPP